MPLPAVGWHRSVHMLHGWPEGNSTPTRLHPSSLATDDSSQALLTARWVCARRKLLFLSSDQVPSAAERCHNTRTEQGRRSSAKPFELGPRSSISRSATAPLASYHSSIDLPCGLLVKLRCLSPCCHYIEPPERSPSGPEFALVFTRLVTPHSLTTFALLAQCIYLHSL